MSEDRSNTNRRTKNLNADKKKQRHNITNPLYEKAKRRNGTYVLMDIVWYSLF